MRDRIVYECAGQGKGRTRKALVVYLELSTYMCSKEGAYCCSARRATIWPSPSGLSTVATDVIGPTARIMVAEPLKSSDNVAFRAFSLASRQMLRLYCCTPRSSHRPPDGPPVDAMQRTKRFSMRLVGVGPPAIRNAFIANRCGSNHGRQE